MSRNDMLTMKIREDFSSVSEFLHRLIQYAGVFRKNNVETWSHLKNKEDFRLVYSMNGPEKSAFEEIYSQGRDCAIALADRLIAFNYPEFCPTLTSFIDSLQDGWLYQTEELEQISRKAKEFAASLNNCPWAVTQMIALYDDQLKLIDAAKTTVEMLRQTRLYKIENGLEQIETSSTKTGNVDANPWWKSFDRRIEVIGLIVALLALAVTIFLGT